jgi:hypothetical protein
MSNNIYFTVFSDKQHSHSGQTNVNTFASFAVNDQLNNHSTDPYDFSQPDHIQVLDNILGVQHQKSTGLLPPGVVSIDDCIIVFESPPKMVHVDYYELVRDDISDNSELNSAYIPVPWQTYVIIHDKNYNLIDTYMYYNLKPISQYGFEEPVFLPVLPNFYSNGLLCRPFYASADDVNMYAKNISGVISAAYDSVWNSGWNADLVDTLIDFNQDIKNNSLYGYSEMINYFSKNNFQFIDSLLKYNKNNLFLNRDSLFSKYVNLIQGLSLVDSLNLVYPIVSKHQFRNHYLEQLRDEFRHSYEYENDDDESEDDDQFQISLKEHMTQYYSKPSSFDEILSYILFSRSSDLNIIDPVNNNYFNYIYKRIINSHPVNLTYSASENEPF